MSKAEKELDLNDVIPTAEEAEKQGIQLDLGRLSGTVTSLMHNIQTLEDLLKFAKVDLTVWEVERHVINKWEVGAKDKDKRVRVTPLYQIKVWLKRKQPQVIAIQTLLDDIKRHAPLLPALPRRKRPANAPRRSLEVCIMDPHIGLLCGQPEADGPWNLDLASAMIMDSMDDLIAKAQLFGPFEEVVMPFGNDFTHSDTVFHTTTAGTPQPESISWHHVYIRAEKIAIAMVERMRKVAPKVFIYEVPGNHSRMADFTIARLINAYFRRDKSVVVDASSSPYKFHRYGVNLIGYEHGHSVKPIRLAALMANERREDWSQTEYREFHLGDQHRKGSAKPSMLEEQGVSIEYIPGLTAPNEWHRLKSFSHQKRGAMAFVWDYHAGPIGRFQFNISQYTHTALKKQ